MFLELNITDLMQHPMATGFIKDLPIKGIRHGNKSFFDSWLVVEGQQDRLEAIHKILLGDNEAMVRKMKVKTRLRERCPKNLQPYERQ